MNTLGIALVWCILQVTLTALWVGGLYLLARWLRPAAAASVLLAGLAMVVILSLVALSPWPRWSVIDRLRSSNAAAQTALPSRDSEPAVFGPVAEDAAQHSMASDRAAHEGLSPNSGLFPRAIFEELWHAPLAGQTTGWHWPAVVAAIVLTAMGCGLLWLVLGAVAVRQQRTTSRPVVDRELSELVDVLGAELGCHWPIEVRQCDDLVTAATIGWRRPILLLPADWTTWTPDQRHAILAHEIAHVRSHDFLALVAGQLGLVLHFYHPLLHWLVGRLRLEQELAADAVAAGISGGQRQYLTTIAQLALRRQERPLFWPARAFLPTRNTFLRRIAMLRDSKLRFDRLSRTARLLAVGGVLACGLLVAGLRGPQWQVQPETVAKAADEAPGTTASEKTSGEPSRESDAIVEGVGWKRVHLGMDRQALIKALGRPDNDSSSAWLKWTKKSLDCFFYTGCEGVSEIRFNRGFKAALANGIRVGSPASAMLTLYGEPDHVMDQGGAKKYEFSTKGLLFWTYGGKISQIVVIEPTSAEASTPAASPAAGEATGKEPASGDDDAAALLQQGWQLWQKGQMVEAAAKFRQAVKLTPDNANAWNGLGWATFNSGKASEAKAAFQRVLAIQPDHPAALNGLGQLYLLQRKYDLAERYLLKAAPQAPAAWYGLARLYLLQGKFEQAEKYAQRILDSGQADDVLRRMLQAAKDKKLSDGLRITIEPPPAQNDPAAEPERPATKPSKVAAKTARGAVQLGYVGDASSDKRSLGGSGHAVAFERSETAKKVVAIEIYASRYGYPVPPAEDFHVYLLDKDRKVIEDFRFPYAKIERGPMRWCKLPVAATEVPEQFYVALSFNPQQTKGIYLGLDKSVKESHSYIGLPAEGFEAVGDTSDWMVRVDLR